MNYARELTIIIIIIIIITKNNRNINGVSIEGEDITQTIAFQTPGGANKMVLECLCTPSWCVIFLFFLNFEPKFFFLSPSLSPQKTEN